MSIEGSPDARFRRAVETGSALLATAAAHELPPAGARRRPPPLLVYARDDPGRFDRDIGRWHARLCLDADGLDQPTAQTALAAAGSLPGPHGRAAAELLAAIAAAHDFPKVAEVLGQWRECGTGRS